MLPAGYQRAVSQLRAHQRWLHCFQLSTRAAFQDHSTLAAYRGHAPLSGLHRRAGFATGPVKIRKHIRKADAPDDPQGARKHAAQKYHESVREDLRQAVSDRRLGDVVRHYDQLKDKGVLNRHDVRSIAQCLHFCFRETARTFGGSGLKERQDKILEFAAVAEKLVADLKDGLLPVQSVASTSVHLLGFFKEARLKDAGLHFWDWLEKQDDHVVTADVYGAAIELSTVAGFSLSETEELYQRALIRFPSNFAAYHLSPDAVVPNRSSAVHLPGIPMVLLQGIMTARLLHGDLSNAYLALDTALRLYPDQTPTRFFTIFLEERPLSEAYAVFAMACRAGITLPNGYTRKLQARLQHSSDQSSLLGHAISVRAQISALYMYSRAGGQLSANMANEIIISITRFVRLPEIITLDAERKRPIVLKLTEIIRETMTLFARFGVQPLSAAFNSIIGNLGGWGLARDVIEVAVADARALGIEPTPTTRRSIMIAYGLNRDELGVARSWEELFKTRRAFQQLPDATDWHCLIKAAHTAGCIHFAESEFELWNSSLAEPAQEGILTGFAHPENYGIPYWTTEAIDTTQIITELDKVAQDLKAFAERTGESHRAQSFCNQALPMTILTPQVSVPEAAMAKLYDECTIEGRSAHDDEQQAGQVWRPSDTASRPIGDAAVTRTRTGISFDAIRYQNWKSVNWLLEQSQLSEQAYLESVEKAIAKMTASPHRPMTLSLEGVTDSYGLSDAIRPVEQEVSNEEAIAAWRKRVMKLRAS